MKSEQLLRLDQQYVWHPYSPFLNSTIFPVDSASGVNIKLVDGRELVDGMSSWWCAIHGYCHPVLDQAIQSQTAKMSHMMFGGLTHQPAVELAEALVSILPEGLERVFFSDSGSVSVEVAMKMAIQYWYAKNQSGKQQFLTLRGGYHGDTMAAMSVCDPVTGMHSLFGNVLSKQYFAPRLPAGFDAEYDASALAEFENQLKQHHQSIAGIILEPIVQGAGGMYFYSPEYLKKIRQLANQYDVLLILDEIATGFGRTGKLFASEHADISPDIMCIGKSLTGGYMTLAATITTPKVSDTISTQQPGAFMHGPTFMANPLACAIALANVRLLLSYDWQLEVERIKQGLIENLTPCCQLDSVKEVRVLGAIGVVEMQQPVDMSIIQPKLVAAGVWVRPFGKLVYVMPAYIMDNDQLKFLCAAIFQVLSELEMNSHG